MLTGGKKYQKPIKTKFRKTTDTENVKTHKQKHHDKSTWRLLKQEKVDVVQRYVEEKNFGVGRKNKR